MAITPNGKFLYTPNTTNAVGYSIDAGGNLSAIPGSPFANPETNAFSMNGIAVDSSGSFLYSSDMATGNIIGYTIDANSGALTAMPIAQMSMQSQPRQMAASPGKFLYVTDDLNNAVLAFSFDSASGAITPVAGSPFPIPTGNAGINPIGITLDAAGKFVFVANAQGNGLSGFAVNQTSGALTDVPGSPYMTANTQFTQTCCVAAHPSGKFVYALNQLGPTVSGFTADSTTGALTPIAGSPFAIPILPNGTPNANGPMLIEPSGKFMYIGLGDLYLSVFAIDTSTGALKPAKASPVAVPFAAQAMAITTKRQ
jgi:6-phosphogluconolactonase